MRFVFRTLAFLAAAAGALAAAAFTASPAHACGGFFCNNSLPVNQSAERIIFSHNEDGTVTAVIEIQYTGPSERFAWMLPVAGNPDVAVSSRNAFDQLQQASNPQYTMTTRIEGTCGGDRFGTPTAFGGGSSDAGFAAADSGAAPPDPTVTVVGEGAVGPYDYVVISVDPEAADSASEAILWLQDNGYDVDESGASLLRPYLDVGMNLISFRLSKGNDTGSIRPVRITFGSGLPSIPIRPTAVAAQDDMGVMVWVLGEARAVPANYMSLELNEALINWFSPGSNYDAVVTAAADEAGGQGFVTEQAGAAAPFADSIYPTWLRESWSTIETGDWTNREGELLGQLSQFSSYDGMRDALLTSLPVPDGVTEEELLACVTCYYDFRTADFAGLEPSALVDAVRTLVIEPLADTADLFTQRPYVTRLYTTMSADEMTMDPIFDFNEQLPDYSNVHTVVRVIECSPSISQFNAPWRVELPSGEVVRGDGNTWPLTVDELPANRRILRVGNTGTGDVVVDNVGAIREALASHNLTVGGPPDERGCSVSSFRGGSAAAFGLVILVALGLFRRRR